MKRTLVEELWLELIRLAPAVHYGWGDQLAIRLELIWQKTSEDQASSRPACERKLACLACIQASDLSHFRSQIDFLLCIFLTLVSSTEAWGVSSPSSTTLFSLVGSHAQLTTKSMIVRLFHDTPNLKKTDSAVCRLSLGSRDMTVCQAGSSICKPSGSTNSIMQRQRCRSSNSGTLDALSDLIRQVVRICR